MQMRTDEIMQTAAFQGCIVSVVFAMVVLAVATTNLLLAFLALVAISGIVVCCIGFLVFLMSPVVRKPVVCCEPPLRIAAHTPRAARCGVRAWISPVGSIRLDHTFVEYIR